MSSSSSLLRSASSRPLFLLLGGSISAFLASDTASDTSDVPHNYSNNKNSGHIRTASSSSSGIISNIMQQNINAREITSNWRALIPHFTSVSYCATTKKLGNQIHYDFSGSVSSSANGDSSSGDDNNNSNSSTSTDSTDSTDSSDSSESGSTSSGSEQEIEKVKVADDAIVIEDLGDDESWEQEKSKCAFCAFFFASPCKTPFKFWSKCVDRAKAEDKDFAQSCHLYTSKLLDCTSENESYFEAERKKEETASSSSTVVESDSKENSDGENNNSSTSSSSAVSSAISEGGEGSASTVVPFVETTSGSSDNYSSSSSSSSFVSENKVDVCDPGLAEDEPNDMVSKGQIVC